MLSRSVHEGGGCLQLVEDCKTHLLAETRCRTEEREKKLQGYCIDVGDVDVVCDLCYSSLGEIKERLKDGSSCAWVGSTVSAVSTFKY